MVGAGMIWRAPDAWVATHSMIMSAVLFLLHEVGQAERAGLLLLLASQERL